MVAYFASLGLLRSAMSRGSGLSLVATVLRGLGAILTTLLVIAMILGIGYFLLTMPFLSTVFEVLGVRKLFTNWGLELAAGLALVLAWRFYQKGNLRLWEAQAWIDLNERYGRSLSRTLARAVRRQMEQARAKQEALARLAASLAPPAAEPYGATADVPAAGAAAK